MPDGLRDVVGVEKTLFVGLSVVLVLVVAVVGFPLLLVVGVGDGSVLSEEVGPGMTDARVSRVVLLLLFDVVVVVLLLLVAVVVVV